MKNRTFVFSLMLLFSSHQVFAMKPNNAPRQLSMIDLARLLVSAVPSVPQAVWNLIDFSHNAQDTQNGDNQDGEETSLNFVSTSGAQFSVPSSQLEALGELSPVLGELTSDLGVTPGLPFADVIPTQVNDQTSYMLTQIIDGNSNLGEFLRALTTEQIQTIQTEATFLRCNRLLEMLKPYLKKQYHAASIEGFETLPSPYVHSNVVQQIKAYEKILENKSAKDPAPGLLPILKNAFALVHYFISNDKSKIYNKFSDSEEDKEKERFLNFLKDFWELTEEKFSDETLTSSLFEAMNSISVTLIEDYNFQHNLSKYAKCTLSLSQARIWKLITEGTALNLKNYPGPVFIIYSIPEMRPGRGVMPFHFVNAFCKTGAGVASFDILSRSSYVTPQDPHAGSVNGVSTLYGHDLFHISKTFNFLESPRPRSMLNGIFERVGKLSKESEEYKVLMRGLFLMIHEHPLTTQRAFKMRDRSDLNLDQFVEDLAKEFKSRLRFSGENHLFMKLDSRDYVIQSRDWEFAIILTKDENGVALYNGVDRDPELIENAWARFWDYWFAFASSKQ